MEIRDADEEHSYTDDGEKIVCPVCGTAWLEGVDGEFSSGTCEHLRFTLHSECCDDFDFFGEWDSEGFNRLVEKAREKDGDADILDILGEIQHPGIDIAILYAWQDDPLYQTWTLLGYIEN